jgi:hypothetical protein
MNQMLKAMPSPSGTNNEGLYIPDRGPSAAYDSLAKRRFAHDGTGTELDHEDFLGENGEKIPPASVVKILDFLTGTMSDEDMSQFKSLLQSSSDMGTGSGADEDAETEQERQARLAKRGNEWDGSYSFASDSCTGGGARMAGGNGLEARAVGAKSVNTARAEAEFRKLFPSAGKLSR